MSAYLVSYRPLVNRPAGVIAATRHGISPFVDGSCRREPDFQSEFPSISALCRGRNFAPRLRVGDTAAYITIKGRWGRPPRGALAAHRSVARPQAVPEPRAGDALVPRAGTAAPEHLHSGREPAGPVRAHCAGVAA